MTFIGRLPQAAVEAIIAGKDSTVPDSDKTYLNGGGKCLICHGTHKGKQSAKTTWYRNEGTKTVFALSDSCRADYLQVQGIERVLTNPDAYRTLYPKAAVK